jgi:KamA family protein
MAIPTVEELVISGSMGQTTEDPYGDDNYSKGNGILHKYPYSVLIIVSENCAMYCRHCFRKRFVGLSNDKTVRNFNKAAQYIAEHKEITNVVISGGDPLLFPTSTIGKMLNALIDIEHINYVRIGTRTPVVFPMRLFDDELIRLFREFNRKKALYLAVHFNHAREITPIAIEAVLRVREAGLTVNNQAVLLKGVNDSVSDLVSLMNGLVKIGVNPYYLYQCMPVSRVRHHFQVPLIQGVDIVDKVKMRLDGYAKRFKFIMAHKIGKIEICTRNGDELIMNQIHSCTDKSGEDSRIFIRKLTETGGWLEDLPVP